MNLFFNEEWGEMSLLQKINEEYLGSTEEKIRLLSFILIGNLFCAVGMVFFFQQNKLISGGIGGISLLIHYITDLPTGYFMILLNLPLALLGFQYLPKKFTTYGLISPFVLSLYLMLFEKLRNPFLMEDPILISLAGGVLNGIGMGILFRGGTCQGGLDILAAIYRMKTGGSIGKALLMMNAVVISISSYIFGLQQGMYTVIAMVIGYRILDKIELRIGSMKQIMIMTKEKEAMSNAILNKIHRGVTILHGQGAYSGENQDILMTALETHQIPRLKSLLKEVDPNAFMIMVDATEIKGRGFEKLTN